MSYSFVGPRRIAQRWIGRFHHKDEGCFCPSIQRQSVDFVSTKDLSGKLVSSTWTTSKRKDNHDPPDKRPESSNGELNSPTKEAETRFVAPPLKSAPGLIDPKRRDEARRIVVKRSTDSTSGNSSLPSDPLELRQRVGLINRRFPLEHEITDSGGKTIWIPAKNVLLNDQIVATQIPQIQAAAWLDPATYCRGGGQSIAGTVAARQLLRGKKDLMEVLGHAVYSGSSSKTNRKSIVLLGHGLPPQILQHHINSAAALLDRLQASEISFKQFNVAQHHNSLASTEAVREIRWSHVRDAATGENRVVPWPIDPTEPNPWQDDLQLYWTVMNRIATRLGLAILLKRPQVLAPMNPDTLTSRRPRSDYSLPGIPTNSMLHTPPHHWKVKFSRELHFLPQSLPPSNRFAGGLIHPVLEWTPLEGVAAPGLVCIRLQGESSGSPTMPISLCFDAGFRTHVIPSTSSPSNID
jgi:hypothetical protein